MSPEIVSQIFDLYGKKDLSERTVLQTLSALAAKLAEDTNYPSRKITEYWSLILSACAETGVIASDIHVLVQDYESFFPERLLELFGNIPFVIEGFRVLKLGNPEKVKRPMAALAVMAIAKLNGKVR